MEFNAALLQMLPLVAGVLAGAIAALTLIVNKENKISEFRQAWIDGLREDLANFFSASRTCTRAIQELKYAQQQFKNPMPIDEAMTAKLRHQVAESTYRIKLRLNQKKGSHITLESLMTESSTLVSRYFSGTSDDVDAVLTGIENAANQAREVLKTEWERVKKGELAYRAAKWIALSLFLMFLIAAALIYKIGSSNMPVIPVVPNSEHGVGQTPAAAATMPSPIYSAQPSSASRAK